MTSTPLWRRWWVSELIILVVCVLAITAAFILTPGGERVALAGFEIPEACSIKLWLGVPCPGCGLTRSWVYFAHGEWWTSVSMNWMGPVLFLTAAFQIPLRTFRLVRQWWHRRSTEEPACQP
ncbi:MAG: DUF2752 domain-containing protein [Myxococcota bacterium]